MSYWALLGICVSLYALLNFIILPALRNRWIATQSLAKVGKAGVMAGLTTLRNAALIASITYSAFALLVLTLTLLTGDAGFLARVIDRASLLHGNLDRVRKLVETWLFIVPTALLVYLAWRRARREFCDRFAEQVLDEMDRLNRERAADPKGWTESTAASAKIQALDQQIDQLTAELSRTAGADRDARSRVARALAVAQAERRAADYEARVNLDPIHNALVDHPTTAWGRFGAIFVSRGFLADTKGLTKVLSRATLAALTVALIGFGTRAGLADAIKNGIASLDDLRVESTKQGGPRAFSPPPQAADQAAPLEPDDVAAIRHLTQQFGRALAGNPHWRGLRPGVSLARDVELQLGRRAILNQTTLPGKDGSVARRVVDTAADATAAEREILEDLAGRAAGESRLGADLAQRRGNVIVRWFGSQWADTRKAVLDHAALYRQPVGPDDLQSALLDRMLGAIVNESVPDATSELGKQARSAFNAAAKASLNEGVEYELRMMLRDLENGVPFNQAVERVRTKPITVPVRHVDDVATVLQEHWAKTDLASKLEPHQTRWDPLESTGSSGRNGAGGSGGGSGSGTGSGSGSIDLDDLARSATGNGQRSISRDAFEALAEYEDHFPRTVASQSDTPLGRLVERHVLPAHRTAFQTEALARVTRAHSFTRLRGFSRVGGVLIGVDADNPKDTLDLTDLTWTTTNGRVTLSFTRSSGSPVTAGPYDRSIVHQALAYAADGRPVAVTMTTGQPLSRLKIHLHPALIDTPLGCHVIALDRFVDTYAGEALPRRQEISGRFAAEQKLYRVAWAYRATHAADQLSRARLGPDALQFVDTMNGIAKQTVEAASRPESGIREALAQVAAADPQTSVFKRKPEYFDSALADSVTACIRHRDAASFGGCVQSRTGTVSVSDAARWLNQTPARFQEWSGVRERSFRVDRGLAFVRSDQASDPTLQPFRFMVQLAFTSPAINVADPESYSDESPLEFEEIEGDIHERVRAGVAKDHHDTMLADLRSFTLLQRLFRAVLKGQGGARFPVRRLVELGAATAGSVPYVHTRRWNGSESRLFTQSLRRALATPAGPRDPAWTGSARSTAAQCVRQLDAAANGQDERWRAACTFSEEVATGASSVCRLARDAGRGATEPACDWATVAVLAPRLPAIYRNEHRFGVTKDEELEAQSSCERLPSTVERRGTAR